MGLSPHSICALTSETKSSYWNHSDYCHSEPKHEIKLCSHFYRFSSSTTDKILCLKSSLYFCLKLLLFFCIRYLQKSSSVFMKSWNNRSKSSSGVLNKRHRLSQLSLILGLSSSLRRFNFGKNAVANLSTSSTQPWLSGLPSFNIAMTKSCHMRWQYFVNIRIFSIIRSGSIIKLNILELRTRTSFSNYL